MTSARRSTVRLCDTAVSGSCKKTLYAKRQDFGAAAMMTKVALQRQMVRRAHVQQSAAKCWPSATRRTLPIGHRSGRRNQRKREREKETRAREQHEKNAVVAADATTALVLYTVHEELKTIYSVHAASTAFSRPFYLCCCAKSLPQLCGPRSHPCSCRHGCTCPQRERGRGRNTCAPTTHT